MNQPVKPKQTLTLLESSSRTEDAGKCQDRPCHLAATATTRYRDVSAAVNQVVKAFEFR